MHHVCLLIELLRDESNTVAEWLREAFDAGGDCREQRGKR